MSLVAFWLLARHIAVLMLVKCIRIGAIRQFALRSVLHQIDNCYSNVIGEGVDRAINADLSAP